MIGDDEIFDRCEATTADGRNRCDWVRGHRGPHCDAHSQTTAWWDDTASDEPSDA